MTNSPKWSDVQYGDIIEVMENPSMGPAICIHISGKVVYTSVGNPNPYVTVEADGKCINVFKNEAILLKLSTGRRVGWHEVKIPHGSGCFLRVLWWGGHGWYYGPESTPIDDADGFEVMKAYDLGSQGIKE